MATLNEYADWIKRLNDKKGFWWYWNDPKGIGTALCLIHSEVSEALEELRDLDKNGVIDELMDVIVRCLHLVRCIDDLLDIDTLMRQILVKSEERPYKHGGRLF